MNCCLCKWDWLGCRELPGRDALLLLLRYGLLCCPQAPFMLFVEVLEGQADAGDKAQPLFGGAEGIASTAGAVAGPGQRRLSGSFSRGAEDASGGAGGRHVASAGGVPAEPVVQFGKRETYGIALTGIGPVGPSGGGMVLAGSYHQQHHSPQHHPQQHHMQLQHHQQPGHGLGHGSGNVNGQQHAEANGIGCHADSVDGCSQVRQGS